MDRSSSKGVGSVKLSPERKELLSKVLQINPKLIVEEGIHAYLREFLLILADLLMETEVKERAGSRYSRDSGEHCNRWGKQSGSIMLLEQKTSIQKPRLRTKGADSREIELLTYNALNERTALNEQAGAKLLSGLSTRRFEKTVESMLEGKGIGRQTISRRGIVAMTKRLEEFRKRSLEGIEFQVIFVDAIALGDTVYVVAVGLDVEGRKHVLDFEPGSTESSGVCRALLSNLLERGVLNAEGAYLFIIDGGKGLRKAIREVFGKRVQVQRCVEHKKRNVEGKLPKYEQQEFRHKFTAAFSKTSHKEAETAFDQLRRDLIARRRHAAANSLLEGLTEILTLHRLGINGMLRRSLCTTNAIESVFSAARYYTRNVKRWQSEEQMERWIAAGLLEAEQNLRKVPGHTQLKKLKTALLKP